MKLPLVARVRTLGLSIALATAGLGTMATIPASASGAIWHVQAGAVNAFPPNLSTEITAFYPANVALHRGDQVLFAGVGVHTVTFNPPPLFGFDFGGPQLFNGTTLTVANRDGGDPLSSGGFGIGGGPPPPPGQPPPPPPPPTYTLTVDAPPGTYHFTCRFHRQMAGSISVVPDGQALPSTDAANQVAAKAAINADIALGGTILSQAANRENNGVAAGVGATSTTGIGAVSVLRFAPSTINVEVGETVTFVNEDINAPHTVTFGLECCQPPGAPPGFLPYGGNTISDPSQQVNSGFLISQALVNYLNAGFFFPPSVPAPHTSVSFTFTKAGTYPYICALHEDLGMIGTVVVQGN
jgi:plastocyanin